MENLGIDIKLLIAQVINFIILFFVFRRYLAKPFINYLKEERKKDEDKSKILSELETKHDRMIEEEQEFRKKLKQEQEKILNETKRASEKLKEELMKKAKDEADDIISKAKRQIEDDREVFYKEVKSYITDTSIFMIEKALKQNLTTEVQKKLTEHVLSNLQKK
ncbi:MAG: ATP synthase F0 subunit B [Candidatus Roizmanbacteria bacterium]|nr:MAG: ATP synthase F0 subunit B [Candidatus Roizmanbacteria bacterium]